MIASKDMEKYFESLNTGMKIAFDIATEARKKGHDPDDKVEVTLAKNMAERVVGLISVVAPQIVGSGVVERIIELEKEHGVLDWRVALQIALEVAQEKFCKFKEKKEAMEVGIRTGFAYGTVGVVSSPLEGFVNLDIRPRRDGKGEYFCMNFSGPIRNAGGTAASWSVIIADYVRVHMGYAPYDPDEKEVKRIYTEISDYHNRVTNLQYFPSEGETEFLGLNLPIEISGDPSEKFEVSNYKDLPRISTNLIRSGYCLIHSSCIPLKARKLWKFLSRWGEDFGLGHWKFLEEFIKIQKKAKAAGNSKKKDDSDESKLKVPPDYTFIKDLVAGRPVFAHPLEKGGFRLRYGRSRTSGYSAQSLHPSTMFVLNDFIAIGTQLKVERPGKGAAFTPCDLIEGPIVKLKDGSVVFLENEALAKQYNKQIKEILFLGDALINYGDFLNRAHSLVPPGYCEEWWEQELEKAAVDLFGNLDVEKLHEFTGVDLEILSQLLENPYRKILSKDAIILSKKLNIPLHPRYTYHWKDISLEQFKILCKWIKTADIKKNGEFIEKIILKFDEIPKRVIEFLGIPHLAVNNEFVVIKSDVAQGFMANLNDFKITDSIIDTFKGDSVLDLVNVLSNIKIRDKSGIYIGGRMGRPEKAKIRRMTGNPHVLFPVAEEGGRMKSFQAALEVGKVRSDFPINKCEGCGIETVYKICDICGGKTKKMFFCKICGVIESEECEHGKAFSYKRQDIDIKRYFNHALKILDTKTYPDLIKGVKGTRNREHIPEQLVKGILRAKHDIFVNKDGTIRYDASEIPVTHFKPKEVRTSIEKLKELGYIKDIKGKPLENDCQILEIKPQDVILPCCPDSPDEPADNIFYRTTKYIDELLVKLYGLDPFYNLKSKDDLVGHLIIGLAPHTSAGTLGRIIGFSKTQGFFSHPLFHAAMRRDCDGDESCFLLLLDTFLNFSKLYLPQSRGSTMDAPLVLTSILAPGEVDDMAFDVDIVWKYPLEFYEACMEYKMPWDIEIKQIKNVLNTPQQYEGMGFTHDTADFNAGVLCSSYKTLPSMQDKLVGQMDVAVKIRAVDESDVARLVIEKHFIRDTKGNLRKFSMQQFRCVGCNAKFRRPPLIGKCTTCGGKIIFTIAEGSVVKYLEPSISLANKYNVTTYLKQTLELTKRRVEGVFGKEKEIQSGLGQWFG
ncbi:MAG: DNA polymerase II large subunit [Nanoarchaeota archaeon]|nr:DNA polymerase II large subunit [Nanoarchaeota archaeon]